MSLELFTSTVYAIVAQYLAWFALGTMVAWAVSHYLWAVKWQRTVRDTVIYLLIVGSLTMTLALRPEKYDPVLWTPITWFSFSMLMIMECLWVSFLIEALLRLARALPHWLAQRVNADPAHPHGPSMR